MRGAFSSLRCTSGTMASLARLSGVFGRLCGPVLWFASGTRARWRVLANRGCLRQQSKTDAPQRSFLHAKFGKAFHCLIYRGRKVARMDTLHTASILVRSPISLLRCFFPSQLLRLRGQLVGMVVVQLCWRDGLIVLSVVFCWRCLRFYDDFLRVRFCLQLLAVV